MEDSLDQGLLLVGLTSTTLLVEGMDPTYELLFMNLANGEEVRLAVTEDQVAQLNQVLSAEPGEREEPARTLAVAEEPVAAPQSIGEGSIPDIQSI